jgi:hypothetical protein
MTDPSTTEYYWGPGIDLSELGIPSLIYFPNFVIPYYFIVLKNLDSSYYPGPGVSLQTYGEVSGLLGLIVIDFPSLPTIFLLSYVPGPGYTLV